MRGVEDDVVQHIVVARRQMGEQRPGGAAVLRDEHLSRAGAQQDAIRIRRDRRPDCERRRPPGRSSAIPTATAKAENMKSSTAQKIDPDSKSNRLMHVYRYEQGTASYHS